MKKFLLVLFLLPMILFGLHATLLPDYMDKGADRIVKGDSSGVTITANAAEDTNYIKYINVGKYNKGSLYLYGDIDSTTIKYRQAPTVFELANAEWDSLNATAATDTVKIVEITSLPYSEYMDLILICKKVLAGEFRWYYDFGL